MEEKILHRWLCTIEYKRLVGRPRHRWKILISSYIRCKVADGIDLAEGACKPRMNVHSQYNVGRFSTCWATACFAGRQCCGGDGIDSKLGV
jgi:hypothetical protein